MSYRFMPIEKARKIGALLDQMTVEQIRERLVRIGYSERIDRRYAHHSLKGLYMWQLEKNLYGNS